MRAFLLAIVAVFALAACGEQPAASDGAGQSTEVQFSQTKADPEPPSVIAEPTPPAEAKPRDPSTGEPPVTIGPSGPVVPDGVTEVPASQIDASAVVTYSEYGKRVWMFDGGFSLQLFGDATSSCGDVQAIVTDQAADSVTIDVRAVDQPQGGGPDDDKICASVMTPKPIVVTLDTPLQDRMVVLSAGR
jgi:hypothetical protein